MRCIVPECDGPGCTPSRSCGRHSARRKYPTELCFCACGCGKPLGPQPGSRRREGRGKYRPECWPAVRRDLPQCQPERLRTLNPDGGRKYFRDQNDEVARKEAEGLLDATRAAQYVGITRMWLVWHYRQHGEIHCFDGSPRLLFRREVLDVIRRTRPGARWSEFQRGRWRRLSRDPRWFARWYLSRWKSTKMFGRLAAQLAERPDEIGRPRAIKPGVETQVRELIDLGWSNQAIADEFGISREPVRLFRNRLAGLSS
jgi:hypothetical protein